MPRLSRKRLCQRNNKGAHQRRRTTRGHRAISKFVKYKYYAGEEIKDDVRMNYCATTPAEWR